MAGGAELLVEVHETFRPNVRESSRGASRRTHELEWIAPGARHLEDLPMFWDLPLVSETQTESLYSELRLWRTSWLHAVPAPDGLNTSASAGRAETGSVGSRRVQSALRASAGVRSRHQVS